MPGLFCPPAAGRNPGSCIRHMAGLLYTNPALTLVHADGQLTTELVFSSCHSRQLDENRTETIIVLQDKVLPLTVELRFTASGSRISSAVGYGPQPGTGPCHCSSDRFGILFLEGHVVLPDTFPRFLECGDVAQRGIVDSRHQNNRFKKRSAYDP